MPFFVQIVASGWRRCGRTAFNRSEWPVSPSFLLEPEVRVDERFLDKAPVNHAGGGDEEKQAQETVPT